MTRTFIHAHHKAITGTSGRIAACVLACIALATSAQTRIDSPAGGWVDAQQAAGFSQDVNYPANRVNVRPGTPMSAQIRGQVAKSAKAAPAGNTRDKAKGGEEPAPATLIVNGVALPVEPDEAGRFERPYAFAAGSNSVELRPPDGSAPKRVQFYHQGSGAGRARLRIVLSWDSPGTDVDLHVISPSGGHSFYGQRTIDGGAALDVDVTTGYGPEIFAASRPLRGTYHVYVNYYGSGEGEGRRAITTAQVAVITEESTLKETQRVFRVPLRSTGDLQHVASFSVL
ncbi:MAG: DUF2135 domain-containing protein [Pseudomonadota bacterium]